MAYRCSLDVARLFGQAWGPREFSFSVAHDFGRGCENEVVETLNKLFLIDITSFCLFVCFLLHY
jgi:hypothetical protein